MEYHSRPYRMRYIALRLFRAPRRKITGNASPSERGTDHCANIPSIGEHAHLPSEYHAITYSHRLEVKALDAY